MDNKIFNVNGRSKSQLEDTLKLLLIDEYVHEQKVGGWRFDKKNGFVLLVNGEKNGHKFPVPLGYKQLTDIIWEWLLTPEAKTVEKIEFDADADHDGSNELGFRVFVNDWGHIDDGKGFLDDDSLGAIKPVYCWYGK